jgi:beta-N-acetylglucosaminidase
VVLASGDVPSARGYIDAPLNGATIKKDTSITGWFLDGNGVSKIEVLIDGNVFGQAQYGSTRMDVQTAYPEYQNANSGCEYTLDTRKIPNGQHSLTVRETANSGITTTIGGQTVNVQNLPAKGYIDFPSSGASIKGDTSISGWFLDGSGVSKIEVLIDGNAIGQAQYGSGRSDVQSAYPDYQNTNSGYQYTIDTRKITNGSHTLTVRETGNNGMTTTLSGQTVYVQNLPGKGYIDVPSQGASLKGDANVSGWFLDGSGVSKIEVLVDGRVEGQAQYGTIRNDVQRAYPDYQIANSGFQYTLNTRYLNNGQHTLTVREFGNNGMTVTLCGQTINVQNLPGKGYIDTPSQSVSLKGDADVSGWFLDGSGVSKVEVLVDGRVIGQAQYGSIRNDVLRAYPDYQNGDSGFEYALNTRYFTNGNHSLNVRETGNNGMTTTLSGQTVNVQNLPTKGYIDTPSAGTVINGDTLVQGWFLSGSGVSKIEVLVDGNVIGQAQYGITRTDVQSAYPDYQNANSGYQYTLDTKQFTDGQHILAVRETGINGEITTLTSQVMIGNGNLYILLDLKKPANITADEIVNFFNQKRPDSPLKNYAQSFIDAQNKYGVNALYLVAHAIWETGWGGSDLGTYKHNLYGYGAFNVCPFTCGYYFPSESDSINKVSFQVRTDYLDPTGDYYEPSYGPTLTGMNVHYATDQNWKTGIANLMASIKPYDYSYYSSVSELGKTGTVPTNYGRDIPIDQPYPVDTILNFPSSITAKTNSSVNFRSLPYVSNSTLISSLSSGTQVTILGYNTDVSYNPGSSGNYAYSWYRVSVNGQNGWLYGAYMDIANLLQANSGGISLNIRSDSSTQAGILTSVDDETYLKAVLSNGSYVTQNGWYNVYLPNSTTTGWVSGNYINKVVH